MRFLAWLFGKKESVATAEGPRGAEGQSATAPPGSKPASEAENLRRWRDSGRPRAWVEAHQGQWGHGEWLALLEELKRSSYWPMQPDAVGAALEEAKREWLRRN